MKIKNPFKKFTRTVKENTEDVVTSFATKSYKVESQNKQLRFLSQASLLEEATLPYRFKFIIFVVAAITFVMITWASIAQIKEVAKTVGEIIPSSPIQVIQHLEGGNISKIMVEDGALVHKGDILLQIAGESVRGELERAEAKDTTLKLQAERYKSFAQYTKADFDKIKKQMGSLAEDQKNILKSMIESREKQEQIIAEQINQRKQSLKITESKIKTLKKNIPLVEESYEKKKGLYDRKFIAHHALIDVEKELNSLKGELVKAESEIQQDRQSIAEYESRLKSLASTLRDDAFQKLSVVESEIAENQKIIDKLKDQTIRLDVRAPISGIVKGMEAQTVGGVVLPGQKIMEIVPIDNAFLAEIKISPNDIGNVEVGQHCTAKISTFDYSRYGGIDGVLIAISPSTYISKEGVPFYKGRIKLEKNYVGKNPKQNLIRPGNIVNVNIITGEKSIMAYLLKPIRNALSVSFSEK